jgi:hypothetical protein
MLRNVILSVVFYGRNFFITVRDKNIPRLFHNRVLTETLGSKRAAATGTWKRSDSCNRMKEVWVGEARDTYGEKRN